MIDYGSVKMERDQADVVLQCATSTLEEAKKSATRFNESLQNIGALLETEKVITQYSLDDSVYSESLSLASNLFEIIRAHANFLLRISCDAPGSFAQTNPYEYTRAYYEKLILSIDQVRSFLENDAIYVRTPRLYSMQSRAVRGKKSRVIRQTQSTSYANSIQWSIKLQENYMTYDFTKFVNKILHFLYVYIDSPQSKWFSSDNDSHETKPIIDAITQFLPNGDSPFTCDIYNTAVRTNEVSEGTYITVTSRSDGIKLNEDVINFWKNHRIDAETSNTMR